MGATSRQHAAYALIGLIVCVVWFEYTNTDLWVQRHFYSESSHEWIWSRHEPYSRFILYDLPRMLFVLFGAALMGAVTLLRTRPFVRDRLTTLRIILLSLLIVPLLIGALKATTNVACPRALVEFGGDVPYVRVLDRYRDSDRPEQAQQCFPAGHAGGGFALLSLTFLGATPRGRRDGACAGAAVGALLGLYKMLIGDHFLSHTLISMALAWFVVNVIAMAMDRIDTVRSAVGRGKR